MDLAYDHRAERDRRKNRSLTNINHLSLAPLTVKLPLGDGNDFADMQPPLYGTSYLEGKSAPTTPRLLSRAATPARSRSHQRVPSASITKSRSSSHLVVGAHARRPMGGSGAATPRRRCDDGLAATPRQTPDSDWLLRTGAFMSSEAREFKGQAWLVSRQSSTSLAGMRDGGGSDDEAPREPELARLSRCGSRRGSRRSSSSVADDDATPPYGSRFTSRFHSRAHSMADENRGHVGTPPALYHAASGNSSGSGSEGSYFLEAPGPDFVNLDKRLEELEGDTTQEDEAAVRRLVRRGQPGKGSWISNVIGWSLFSVDENDEDSDDADDDDGGPPAQTRPGRSGWSARHFEGVSNAPLERIPPPAADEGGWKDAAWLLSVASKVVF